MKSYKLIKSGDPLIEVEIEKPKPTGREVLIKTIACGVCHTDIHLHEGYFDVGDDKKMASRLVDNLTMGHEVYGELVEVGEEVDEVTIGRNYVVYPWIGCGKCQACLDGMEHHCGPFTSENIGVAKDGGYGEFVLVKDYKYLFDAGDAPGDMAGTYACRGLTAYSALKKAKLQKENSTLVIIGAGGLGMLAINIAKAAFNVIPIVVDIDDEKLEIVKSMGIEHVFNSKNKESVKSILELTNGGASSVIDFVGSDSSVEFGFNLFGLKKGGALILVGLLGGKFAVQLPLFAFTARTLQGSYTGSMKEMAELMSIVRDGKINPIETEIRKFSDVNKALKDLKDGKVKGLVSLKY